MMKKLILTIFVTHFCFFLSAQRDQLTLSFTANYYSQNNATDSIRVTNLTRDCDTTLYHPDTVLILDYVTFIKEENPISDQKLILYQNFPNPFSNKTSFGFNIESQDVVSVIVYSFTGIELCKFNNVFGPGDHFFDFIPGNEKQYILYIKSSYGAGSMILNHISRNRASVNCELTYAGSATQIQKSKAADNEGSFQFLPGDSLMFIAYATTPGSNPCSDIKIDSPETSMVYTFSLSEGLPCPDVPMLVHYNEYYSTVQIGNRCWLKNNLNVGTMIPGDQNMKLNGVTEKYCYNNDSLNCKEYGAMYQWRELMTYSHTEGGQGLCPQGWYVPTYQDWMDLAAIFSGDDEAGGYLKETGNEHWNEPNSGATNESGFTAFGSGDNNSGFFAGIGSYTFFMTSTAVSTDSVACFGLQFDSSEIYAEDRLKTTGNPARCIKYSD